MAEILTLHDVTRMETEKIKGSRFIGLAAPATSEEEARAALAAEARREPDANHHCWAWQGAHVDAYRYSDDGEPSGSAGRPIHAAILGRKLRDVLVVVTRYFGGTKLGTGGLVRAYGGAAAAVLESARVVRIRQTQLLRLHFAYEQQPLVQAVLSASGLTPSDAEYGAAVSMTLHVPIEDVRTFERALMERSAGLVRIER